MNEVSKSKFKLTNKVFAKNLLEKFIYTRNITETLVSKIHPEDQIPQSMEDCSPLKWHRAHTTWFFEEVIIKKYISNYKSFNKEYSFLFNSYYETIGKIHTRTNRGLILRPTVNEVTKYRIYIDNLINKLFKTIPDKFSYDFFKLIELGIAHEEQHIELMQSDILNLYAKNTIVPIFNKKLILDKNQYKQKWIYQQGGKITIGSDFKNFSFDSEGPKHEVLIKPFKISSTLVTNGEWKIFMNDGGYNKPDLWLSDGWTLIKNKNISKPLYWHKEGDEWLNISLAGKNEIDDNEPVSHISYYEAEAFARWSNKRLPNEFEWEYSAYNYLDKNKKSEIHNLFGSLWQWTNSYFTPYPNFKPYKGSLGEYNGKFMSNQIVLRGSSFVTPVNHSRETYRNFYYPHMRWMFSGLRLVEDI
mgnify:CR=1 FL=1